MDLKYTLLSSDFTELYKLYYLQAYNHWRDSDQHQLCLLATSSKFGLPLSKVFLDQKFDGDSKKLVRATRTCLIVCIMPLFFLLLSLLFRFVVVFVVVVVVVVVVIIIIILFYFFFFSSSSSSSSSSCCSSSSINCSSVVIVIFSFFFLSLRLFLELLLTSTLCIPMFSRAYFSSVNELDKYTQGFAHKKKISSGLCVP